MKEAAGEANMTVITIVLIGVVAAAGLFLVPRLIKSINKRACCTQAGGELVVGNQGSTCGAKKGAENAYDSKAYLDCMNGL